MYNAKRYCLGGGETKKKIKITQHKKALRFLAAITSSALGISAGLWLLIKHSHKATLQWQSSGECKWRKSDVQINQLPRSHISEEGSREPNSLTKVTQEVQIMQLGNSHRYPLNTNLICWTQWSVIPLNRVRKIRLWATRADNLQWEVHGGPHGKTSSLDYR